MTERGDLMRLKSGGPPMTVVAVSAGGCECKWFEGARLRKEFFAWQIVERVKPQPEAAKPTA